MDRLKQNNYPRGFQILCYNCNNAKSIQGQCPHQIKNGALTAGVTEHRPLQGAEKCK